MAQAVPSAKRQFFTGLIGTSLVLFLGWQGYQYVSEVGLPGLLKGKPTTSSNVSLKNQTVYQIKKKQQLLGVDVIRIISNQQPEEFLVLNKVPKPLIDSMYGKQIDKGWANTVANQFVKLRQTTDEEPSGISVDVQDVKTQKSGLLRQDGKAFPYWQIEIQFKLSNENMPRYYRAGVVRPVESPNQGTEALVVGYAQKEAYQPELVADLLDHLSFEQN